MPAAGRLGDKSQVRADAHGCPACPHLAVGPAVSGSLDVRINARPALREADAGNHAGCCGSNTWRAITGAPAVLINGRAAHRVFDKDEHCGGIGVLVEGSGNVIIGNWGGKGALAAHEGGFVVKDHRTGMPLSNTRYRINSSDGQVLTGKTDKHGRTLLIRSKGAVELTLALLDERDES